MPSSHDLEAEAATTCASASRPTRRADTDADGDGRVRLRPLLRDVVALRRAGLRIVLFVSGCLLRCTYCHNPDTWHLKDGTYVAARHVLDRLAGFAPALRQLDGGLTISGGEPMVQMAFTAPHPGRARRSSACTPRSRPPAFSATGSDDDFLSQLDLVLLDIKSFDPGDLQARHRPRRCARRCASPSGSRAIGKPVWVRFTLVPGPHRRSRERRGQSPASSRR